MEYYIHSEIQIEIALIHWLILRILQNGNQITNPIYLFVLHYNFDYSIVVVMIEYRQLKMLHFLIQEFRFFLLEI